MIYVLGGRDNLNFKVVNGTSIPSNPKENTIWIKTARAIPSFEFSAIEPYRKSNNKNLNVYPYYHTTRTENGITFTDNKDGTVTVNGTATADTFFRLHYIKSTYLMDLEPGTYTISDAIGTAANGRTEILVSYNNGTSWTTAAHCSNNSQGTFTLTQRAIARMAIKIYKGNTFNNAVFKPQLEKNSSATFFIKGDATDQVWITTDITGITKFNVLKNNCVIVYPISVKQYTGRVWENKTAQIYQNGAWINLWDNYLYKNGVIEKTLKAYAYKNSNSTSTPQAPTVTEGTSSLTLNEPGTASVGYAGSYFADEAIDLTNYSTISIQVTDVNCPLYASIRLCVVSRKENNFSVIASTSLEVAGTKTIDISSLSGEYYVCIELAGVGSKSVTFSNWWLK